MPAPPSKKFRKAEENKENVDPEVVTNPGNQFLRTLSVPGAGPSSTTEEEPVTTVIQKELVTPANYVSKKKRSGVPELQMDISKRYLIEDGMVASSVRKVWTGVGERGPYKTVRKYINFEKEYGAGKPFSMNIAYDAVQNLISCLQEIQAETDKILQQEEEDVAAKSTSKETAETEESQSQMLE